MIVPKNLVMEPAEEVVESVTDTKNTEHYGTHYWDQNGKVITANLTEVIPESSWIEPFLL